MKKVSLLVIALVCAVTFFMSDDPIVLVTSGVCTFALVLILCGLKVRENEARFAANAKTRLPYGD